MVRYVTEIPKLLARLDITVAGGKEFQFNAKIYKFDNDVYVVEDLLDVVKRAHEELAETLATDNGRIETMVVKSSFASLPEDPIVEVDLSLLKNLSLEYALANALDWKHPRGGVLSYQFGAIQHTHSTSDHDFRGTFNPLTDLALCTYFLDHYKISLMWNEPKTPGGKYQVAVMNSSLHYDYQIPNETLPAATTWHVLLMLNKKSTVSVPLSILEKQQ